ncbi:hypothetical protein BG011_007817 [Mortierella polycephala]|uniref:Transmembrane protein n=1 Tax=Mortierella polycephala TaxID=41804 RepID=A0A9P6PRG4_9FUNG|nr:hypothetical protein BG011_007817 [Mortierella polycephala]
MSLSLRAPSDRTIRSILRGLRFILSLVCIAIVATCVAVIVMGTVARIDRNKGDAATSLSTSSPLPLHKRIAASDFTRADSNAPALNVAPETASTSTMATTIVATTPIPPLYSAHLAAASTNVVPIATLTRPLASPTTGELPHQTAASDTALCAYYMEAYYKHQQQEKGQDQKTDPQQHQCHQYQAHNIISTEQLFFQHVVLILILFLAFKTMFQDWPLTRERVCQVLVSHPERVGYHSRRNLGIWGELKRAYSMPAIGSTLVLMGSIILALDLGSSPTWELPAWTILLLDGFGYASVVLGCVYVILGLLRSDMRELRDNPLPSTRRE